MKLGRSIARSLRRSPYIPVVTHPVLRRILPGIGLSSIGDGMSTVAISWLALQLASGPDRTTWVAAAVAAYSLPGIVGAVAFTRFLDGRPGAQLAGWDAALRTVFLGVIPVAHAFDVLTPPLYVSLLAVSSLLSAWGKAGRYTLLAELLPDNQLLAGNAVVNLLLEFSVVGGPALAALVIAVAGPAAVIAVDAGTFAVLAATYRFAIPRDARGTRVAPATSRAAGFRLIRADPRLVALLLLSFCFFLFFGPVTVALPVHVARDLHASASELAGFYTAFGIGAVLGSYGAPHLGQWPLLLVTVATVTGFGVALLPVGLGLPFWAGWIAFGICGLVWGPFPSTTTTLFQRAAHSAALPQILAARGAMTAGATPLGALLAAPIVSAIGAQATIAASAVATIVLGVSFASFLALRDVGGPRRSIAA